MGVVLITGCSSGIGMATALAFARRGDRVHATMRDPARGDELRRRAEAEGLDVRIAALDVRDAAAVDRAVADLAEGGPDVVVANAGIGRLGTMEETDLAVVRDVMDTNFWGAYHLARSALPYFRTQGRGTIVLVSSVAGRVPSGPGLAIYGSTKHALSALADTLAAEAGPYGVRVVAAEPGFVITSIVDNAEAVVPPGSPYEGMLREVLEVTKAAVEAGADPSSCADAIVAAATDPAAPVHVLIGDDALAMAGVFQEVGYEGWATVDWDTVMAGPAAS